MRVSPALVSRLRVLNGPAGRAVDRVGPREGRTLRRIFRGQHLEKGARRDQPAVGAIDDVEEAVLRRLHRHLARPPVDREVGEHDGLRGGVVPGLARRGLVVPPVGAGLRIERDDRREKEVVAAAGRADLLVPRRPVPDPHEQLVELRVVHDRVPGSAAASAGPPLAGPRLGRARHHRVGGRAVGAFRRVAWHGVEAPLERARVRVVRGDVAAHAVLGAAVANVDETVGHPGRAGDGVGLRLIDGHRLPGDRPGRGVERDEAAVDHADEHLAAVDRDAAIHDIAAGLGADRAIHLRIVHPQAGARSRVDRVHDAPGRRDVHHAIDDERRGLGPAIHREVV